jgi:aspartate/methionine/tyrosine aminotransferase
MNNATVRQTILDLPASRIHEVTNAGRRIDGLVPLWFGEGDEVTPQFIRDAATDALSRGETFYGPNRGIPQLREAIQRYLHRIYGCFVDLERILVTASGMNGLMISMQSLVGPGDSAVVVGPIWPNGQQAIAAMGAAVRRVELSPRQDGSWTLDLDRLLDACDETTRLILVNSPNNPTGWTATGTELQAILAHARSRGIWVLADEVYGRITRNGCPAPSFVTLAEPDDPVVIINSFSKTWSMTGWRLGWIVAPPSLGPTLEKMTEFNIAHAATFIQWGGVAALNYGDDYVDDLIQRYAQAAEVVHESLSDLPGIRLSKPQSAFYAFFGVDGMKDSFACTLDLLKRAKVGLAPGAAFGPSGEGRLRLCFAASMPKLALGLERLVPALREIARGA